MKYNGRYFLLLSASLCYSDFPGKNLSCTPPAEEEERASFGENFPDHNLHLPPPYSRVTLRSAPDKGIEGRLAVIYVLPGNRNFRSAVLPRLHWTVWKQLDQQLWATQAESNKINTASNNKRISSFQYFPSPYLLNSLVLL